jgi:hypothetical protein
MGMELRRDWKADAAPPTEPQTAPAQESRGARLLVIALAVAGGLTLGWIAFLCSFIGRLVGTLF